MNAPISALERITRRLQLLVGRGRITFAKDEGPVQVHQVQVNDREIIDMPRIMEYGFSSMPKVGCQAVVIFVGGERSNGVILGTNDERARLAGLQPGEVALYDDQGQSVWIKRGGIVIECAGKPLTINDCPSIKHDGVEIGKLHVHGGVQSGGSKTSVPQ